MRAGLLGRKPDRSVGESVTLEVLDTVVIDDGLWRSDLSFVGVVAGLGEDGGNRGGKIEACSISRLGLAGYLWA